MNVLQSTQLRILKEIDILCKNNNITYYLFGGTALGAARHQGFIPWDDDMDIIMKNDDYNRFVEAFQHSSLTNLILQEFYINKRYFNFSKVRLKGTTQIESEADKSSAKMQGVFIDVFLLRKCSSTKLLQLMQYWCSQYLTLLAQIENGWTSKKKGQNMAIRIAKHLPNRFLAKIANHYICRKEKITRNYKYCFFELGRGIHWKKLVFAKTLFLEPEFIFFEDAQFPVPTDNNSFLTQFYGDYMTPPPENNRYLSTHGITVDVERDYHEYLNNKVSTVQSEVSWIEYSPINKQLV